MRQRDGLPGRSLPAVAVLALFIVAVSSPVAIGAQAGEGTGVDAGSNGPVLLRFSPPSRLTISRRADFSTYQNGRYQGLVSQEVVIDLEPIADQEGRVDASPPVASSPGAPSEATAASSAAQGFVGQAIVYEQQRRGGAGLRRVEESATIRLDPVGREVSRLASDLPVAVVSAPLIMAEGPVRPGDTWSTRRTVTFAPFGEAVTTIPVGVDYTYRGIEEFEGAPVHRIDAVYGLRFPTSDEPYDPGPLARVSGGHEVTILFHESGRYPVFLRDVFYEAFAAADGTQEEHRGFVVAWYRLTASQALVVDLSDQPDVTVEEEGPALRVRVGALNFYPDEARLLPESQRRVEAIAERLRDAEAERYLVVGHTADVGNPQGQQALSEERAENVAEILAEAGVPRRALAFEGKGATRPLADNGSEAGRAANRRVEIFLFTR